MSLPHWEYFLSIEKDLLKCTNYVDFTEDNYNTYSIEFAKIIMTSGAEIDVIMKLLCKSINPSLSPRNITEYYNIIHSKYPKFNDFEIELPKYHLSFKPWENWTNTNSPAWWKDSFNKIKHERDIHFSQANLNNTLQITSGLLCLILYYYKETQTDIMIDAFNIPHILSPRKYPINEENSFQEASISVVYTVPDYDI